tara:strand:+ start:264 stop:512 length:249 start_codon:yes stop_codon:yes gene_type:complete
MVLVVEYGKYLDKCPMASYTCPEICDVDHIHYEKDRDCSFMKELCKKKEVGNKIEEKTYVHLGRQITVEWVASYPILIAENQ